MLQTKRMLIAYIWCWLVEVYFSLLGIFGTPSRLFLKRRLLFAQESYRYGLELNANISTTSVAQENYSKSDIT